MLLDEILLARASISNLRSLMQLLQKVSSAEDEDAVVAAFAFQEHLEAAGERHGCTGVDFLAMLNVPATQGAEQECCRALPEKFKARQLEPSATHVLRTA